VLVQQARYDVSSHYSSLTHGRQLLSALLSQRTVALNNFCASGKIAGSLGWSVVPRYDDLRSTPIHLNGDF